MLGRSHRRAARSSQLNSSLPPQFEPRYAVSTQEHPRPAQDLPPEDPPEYTAARVPTVPVSYAFVPVSPNAMVLIPPPDAPDTRPVYHISTGHNCFIPSSYITTIRRGGTELGEFMGNFEMGICREPATVSMRGKESQIKQKLNRDAGRSDGIWTWSPQNAKRMLFWDFSVSPAVCNTKNDRNPIAEFTPRRRARQLRPPSNHAQLVVHPKGQALFDDILMSVLIIERKRLTPSFPGNRRLFN